MPASESDLIRKALSSLGAIGAGQPIPAEDYEIVRAAIAPKLSELVRRNVIAPVDQAAIPDEFLEWLAILIGQAVALDFGKPMDGQIITGAESRLKEMILFYDPGPVRADYF